MNTLKGVWVNNRDIFIKFGVTIVTPTEGSKISVTEVSVDEQQVSINFGNSEFDWFSTCWLLNHFTKL